MPGQGGGHCPRLGLDRRPVPGLKTQDRVALVPAVGAQPQAPRPATRGSEDTGSGRTHVRRGESGPGKRREHRVRSGTPAATLLPQDAVSRAP